MINPGTGEEEMEFNSEIPQNQPIDARQVPNAAGGFVWQIDGMTRLRRFLCLGSEGGTYYVSSKELTVDNIISIKQLVADGKGLEVVQELLTYSLEGRTAKQDNILFALAYCARQNVNIDVKKAAYEAMPKICRIPTHLFGFIENCEKLSMSKDGANSTGWGRAHRRAIANWYMNYANCPSKLAMHVTKYKNRNGWTHFDVFRLCHLKTDNKELSAIFRYVVKGLEAAVEAFQTEDSSPEMKKLFGFLKAVEDIKKVDAEDSDAIVSLIESQKLVREHIPTNFLNHKEVWRVLLKDMPMTALLRNLGKMSSIELLVPGSEEAALVAIKLKDEVKIKEARIHPFNVMVAYRIYENGKGAKGSLKWNPCPEVTAALDEMFYKSFKFVEATGKRFCLAIDVSGSMSGFEVMGTPGITANVAATAMMMTTLKTEPVCDVVCFTSELTPVNVKKNQTLTQAINSLEGFNFGRTDCSKPMVEALRDKKKYDVFIVYTDNDTWAGKVHPATALRNYRKGMGIWDAKLIVTAFSASEFTIADPEDPGMLDIAGFDSGAPETMRQFILGNI